MNQESLDSCQAILKSSLSRTPSGHQVVSKSKLSRMPNDHQTIPSVHCGVLVVQEPLAFQKKLWFKKSLLIL